MKLVEFEGGYTRLSDLKFAINPDRVYLVEAPRDPDDPVKVFFTQQDSITVRGPFDEVVAKLQGERVNVQSEMTAEQQDKYQKQGFAGIFGKWPGDEPDEQVQQTLEGETDKFVDMSRELRAVAKAKGASDSQADAFAYMLSRNAVLDTLAKLEADTPTFTRDLD